MSDVVEVKTEAASETNAGDGASVDAVQSAGDAVQSVQLAAVTADGKGDRAVQDGAATTARPADDQPAAVPPPPPSGPTVADGSAASSDGGNSSHVDDEAAKEPDVDEPTPGKVPLDGSVAAAVDGPAKPGGDDDGRGPARTAADRDDAPERPSTSALRPAAAASSSAARHALPSAVAAPRATGKHRLPPVLVTSAGQGHGLERTSPLPLVVGSHHPATSTSLTGGTRLGDLGLSQPPPLNLSVVDEAVNMKVGGGTTTTTQRSAADTAGRAAGM